jgi:hypothetical protein
VTSGIFYVFSFILFPISETAAYGLPIILKETPWKKHSFPERIIRSFNDHDNPDFHPTGRRAEARAAFFSYARRRFRSFAGAGQFTGLGAPAHRHSGVTRARPRVRAWVPRENAGG